MLHLLAPLRSIVGCVIAARADHLRVQVLLVSSNTATAWQRGPVLGDVFGNPGEHYDIRSHATNTKRDQPHRNQSYYDQHGGNNTAAPKSVDSSPLRGAGSSNGNPQGPGNSNGKHEQGTKLNKCHWRCFRECSCGQKSQLQRGQTYGLRTLSPKGNFAAINDDYVQWRLLLAI